MFTSKWSFELSRKWHFSYLVNSCLCHIVTSVDVLWMLGPDENLTKCTLLVQSSPQVLIDYHTMLFSSQFSSFIRQSIQESRRVTRGGKGGGRRGEAGGLPCPFLEIGKKCPNLEPKCPDCGYLWVKLFI